MLTGYSHWPGLAQVFEIRTVVRQAGGKQTSAVHYEITSLGPAETGSAQLLRLVREHWEQEAGLHYRRDVRLREDRGPVRQGDAPQGSAALQRAFAYRVDQVLQHQAPA